MVSRDKTVWMDVRSTSYLVRVSRYPAQTVLSHVTGRRLYKVTQALQGKGSIILPLSRSVAPRALTFHT